MKKFVALFLALTLTCGLAACGGGGNSGGGDSNDAGGSGASTEESTDGDEKEDSGSGEKVAINVIAAQYGQNTTKWWSDFVKDFTTEYPNIDLTVEVESWNDI